MAGLPEWVALPSQITLDMKDYQLTEAEIKQLQDWGYEMDEILTADHHIYTYETWLDPDQSMGSFIAGKSGMIPLYLTPFGDSTTKGNGKLKLYILPQSEEDKIEQRKAEIIKGFEDAYLTALIDGFKNQYEKSSERKILLQDELEKVEKLIFGSDEDFNYQTFAGDLLLTFRTYSMQRDKSIEYWHKRYKVRGGDAKEIVACHHATMTAKDLNNSPSDDLHFVIAALALDRFKKHLGGLLEAETAIELTFEDWKLQTDHWRDVDLYPSERPISQSFQRLPAKSKSGRYSYYSLSDMEYKKIASARMDIFERQVELFLQGQIEDFEHRFSTSLDRDKLRESELEKVDLWLTDKTLSEGYVFPNPNGGAAIISDIEGLARKKGEDANLFPYWYDQLIIQGKNASTFIAPKHGKPGALLYPVAVHVLYQYRQFLEKHPEESDVQHSDVANRTTKLKEKARGYLNILSGSNVHGREIMPEEDFQRLLFYVESMIEKGGLPIDLKPISQIDFPNGHIIYLFYLIHKDLFTTKEIHGYFFDFLHEVFEQLRGEKATTRKKFSVKPSTWDTDFGNINR